ncbi:hypothetical protein HPP92_019717 [Vanilla planifolia]|uniref:Uncharacterized protein n=1 Tax=Vanilla planifolia TaxID=51239 RepID=A0A835Q6A4_VANPL|nr:hypothetical protein HPP92_019717 [Vanilla planifolia]
MDPNTHKPISKIETGKPEPFPKLDFQTAAHQTGANLNHYEQFHTPFISAPAFCEYDNIMDGLDNWNGNMGAEMKSLMDEETVDWSSDRKPETLFETQLQQTGSCLLCHRPSLAWFYDFP